MISRARAKQLALSLPEVGEKSHFDQPDFRVKGKIFVVLHPGKNEMMVKLSVIDQSVFCSIDKTIIYPVPGGWGRKGATLVNLKKVNKEILIDALTTAWKTVAPSKLVAKYFAAEK